MDLPTYTPTDTPVPEGDVVLERSSTPQELGPRLNRTAADVVRFLMQLGEMVTATQSLSDEQIELFAEEINATIRLVDPGEEQEVALQELLGVEDLLQDDDEDAEPRPPIITVMGHVDHGKTKLLDKIRDANVVAGEAGGITQAIGAYQAVKNDRLITFIDTPGHEAFTAMRARGAEATDIVVLVVAADDGVMPQTIEALNHAKASGAPIVVAINKIDREQAQPDRVKQQLSEQGLIPQDWGGDVEMIPVSALNGDGVDDLLETLLLVADVEDLKANPEGRAAGVVLESHLDIGRGPGGQHPRAARHAQGGRAPRRRPGLGSGAGAHQPPRRAGQGGRAVDARPGPRPQRRRRGRRRLRRRPGREDGPLGRREARALAPGRQPRSRGGGTRPVPASRTSSSRSSGATSPRSTSCSRPTPPAPSRRSPRASASSSATR